jgi:hypothetical protein
VLGGGGWVDTSCTYFPATGRLDTDITISFGATARLGINFGVASGSVEFYLGLAAEFHSSGGGTTFSLAVVFIIDGNVVVLGILTVDINLTLEVIYADGEVTGYGNLRVRAKLGPFFSISVDKSITYKMGGGSSSGQAQTPPQQRIAQAATQYHALLEPNG